jgi:hypothetical protein
VWKVQGREPLIGGVRQQEAQSQSQSRGGVTLMMVADARLSLSQCLNLIPWAEALQHRLVVPRRGSMLSYGKGDRVAARR